MDSAWLEEWFLAANDRAGASLLAKLLTSRNFGERKMRK
jgi:hypothetical protein